MPSVYVSPDAPRRPSGSLDAAAELTRAGPAGKAVAQAAERLISLKNKAEYQTLSVARSDAHKAIDWAQRLLDAAKGVVSS